MLGGYVRSAGLDVEVRMWRLGDDRGKILVILTLEWWFGRGQGACKSAVQEVDNGLSWAGFGGACEDDVQAVLHSLMVYTKERKGCMCMAMKWGVSVSNCIIQKS